MNTFLPTSSHSGIFAGLAFVAALFGFVVALGLLSGDDEGRVNLLYLLFLFAFLPVLGLLLSVVFIFSGAAKGLSGRVLELPWWPRHWHTYLLGIGSKTLRRYWFFYLTQVIALSLGLGGLLAFVLLLLATDISFVWRSTLLEAADLFPVLQALALPWSFWLDAQPSLELLQRSQDFRLADQVNTAGELGQWWKYAFAAQATYNLLPRLTLLLAARAKYRAVLLKLRDEELVQSENRDVLNGAPEQGQLADVIHEVALPHALIDWAGVPASLLTELAGRLGVPQATVKAGPMLQTADRELDALTDVSSLVVLVKSWEAPMGELGDFLKSLQRSESESAVILPVDWNDQGLVGVSAVHLAEWRRFAGAMRKWKVLALSSKDDIGVAP